MSELESQTTGVLHRAEDESGAGARIRQAAHDREVDVPGVPTGQVPVNVAACGVCHTDLHAAQGDWPVKPELPFVSDHEAVGHVAAVGAGVKHVKEGNRVGVPWLHTACGHCEHCITGWETWCDSQQMTAYTVNGGFAQYVLADAGYVGPVPANLDLATAAPEALQFAADGAVHHHYSTDRLEHINDIFRQMKEGRIDGRIVLEL